MNSENVRYNIIDDSYSSRCFGLPIVTLEITAGTSSLNYLTVSETLDQILQNPNVHYVICKHRMADISVIHGLEEAGFKLMGVGAKLCFVKRSLSTYASANPFVRVEPYDNAHSDLLNSLLEETPRFFYGTHFYNSPYLDSKRADEFYARWITTDVQGRCNLNFIALQNDKIVGLITCMEERYMAKLDLIWVDQSLRRKGIGKLLINTLLNNIRPDKLACDAYVTDKHALSFYISTGFEVRDIYAIYHKYLKRPNDNHPHNVP